MDSEESRVALARLEGKLDTQNAKTDGLIETLSAKTDGLMQLVISNLSHLTETVDHNKRNADMNSQAAHQRMDKMEASTAAELDTKLSKAEFKPYSWTVQAICGGIIAALAVCGVGWLWLHTFGHYG